MAIARVAAVEGGIAVGVVGSARILTVRSCRLVCVQ